MGLYLFTIPPTPTPQGFHRQSGENAFWGEVLQPSLDWAGADAWCGSLPVYPLSPPAPLPPPPKASTVRAERMPSGVRFLQPSLDWAGAGALCGSLPVYHPPPTPTPQGFHRQSGENAFWGEVFAAKSRLGWCWCFVWISTCLPLPPPLPPPPKASTVRAERMPSGVRFCSQV